MSTSLEISQDGRVLRITLNRPARRNALTFEMCRELAGTIEGANAGAILLSAKGDAFCAGMDLDEALEGGAAEHAAIHDRLFTIGSRVSVPIVAAVGGPALGGGLGLLANSHVSIAAQGATFGLTEIRVGMWPFVVYRAMVLAVGDRRALELSLTGRFFGAEEALAWGLVQEIVPTSELDARAAEVAAKIAAFSRDTIQRGMAFVNESRGLDDAAVHRLAARARKPVFEGADFREGVAAFRAKRPPRW
jgi:enoyl-CoA hydratase/carnithine racemase